MVAEFWTHYDLMAFGKFRGDLGEEIGTVLCYDPDPRDNIPFEVSDNYLETLRCLEDMSDAWPRGHPLHEKLLETLHEAWVGAMDYYRNNPDKEYGDAEICSG